MGVVSHIEHHDSVSVVWIWTGALQSTWIPLRVLVIRRLKGFTRDAVSQFRIVFCFVNQRIMPNFSAIPDIRKKKKEKAFCFRWSRFKAWLATGIPRNCDTCNRIYQILVMILMINLVPPRVLSFPGRRGPWERSWLMITTTLVTPFLNIFKRCMQGFHLKPANGGVLQPMLSESCLSLPATLPWFSLKLSKRTIKDVRAKIFPRWDFLHFSLRVIS